MSDTLGISILSDLTVFSKYAKYKPELKRRETWDEVVDRYENTMCAKYPHLIPEIKHNTLLIRNKEVLPSMRAMQFSGLAMEVNNARGYNCAFLHVDSIHSFSETMFLLLGGSGVGYSVQKHHVAKLPAITKPSKTRRFLIQDDIMGWADAVKALMKAFMQGKPLPLFDFRSIREKGARLITAGGKAPGPEPLKKCLFLIQQILERKKDGEKLTPLECHDIMCHIANAVLAGGIRRAAMIALFSWDDEEMLTCKYGNWWELNEQRGRANNSVIIKRGSITKEQFNTLWKKIEHSGSGEPGIYWTNDLEWGTNPCCEIALRSNQFCNLCEVNVSDIRSQEDLNKRVSVAAFFGTLQAGFTDFHYLRPIWKRTTERDALLGIGMTGIGSGEILKYNLEEASKIAISVNERVSELIDINPAARVTCIKPSGTTSCVLGTSSGIHAWHDQYFLRTIRFNKNEDVASYLIVNHPELVEDDVLRPHDTICVRIPIKAPEGSIMRTESSIDLLERVKKFSKEWIKPGHIHGKNTHNVSATVSIKDEEWKEVGEWLWENREVYNGLSVLPYDGGSYIQSPFESLDKTEYEKRASVLQPINLTNVIEIDDKIDFGQIAACAGGQCSIE
jgi:ribonucleoside-diphosphate reductase alpha chain